MRKTLTLFALLLALVSLKATAQDRTITGKVTSSEDNTTIPGVSVVVVGTTIGTSTDMNGDYKLTIPPTAKTLRFSGLGMKVKDVPVGASNSMDIILDADVLKLDEVVVSAIGIKQEKKSVGYSTQTLGGEALTKAGQTNALSSLSGKVSGLQVTQSAGTPGASVNIRLRGVSSITGTNDPLIIVDGVAIDNSHDYSGNPDNLSNNYLSSVNNSNRAVDIDPDNIESVNVLKGPSATALYGINAANGAIVITTKKGTRKAGGGVNVIVGTKLNWSEVNKLPELQDKFVKGSGGNYASYQSTASGSWGPSGDTTYWDPNQPTPFNQYGQMVGATAAANTPGAIKYHPYDNVNDFFRTGFSMENNIAVSGGNDLSTFRISFSRLKDEGIVPLSNFNRYSLSLAGSSTITTKLTASGSITYTKSGGRRVQQGSNLSGLMLDLLRNTPSFDISNGNSDPEATSAYLLPDGTQRNYRGGVAYDNPYWTINQNPFNDDVNRMYGSIQTDYKANSWLSFTYRLGSDFYNDRRKQFFAIGSGAFPDGQVFHQEIFYRHVNSDVMATMTKKFSDNFTASLLLGNNFFGSYKQNMYVEGGLLNFPDFQNISVASNVITRESVNRYRTRAYYGQAKFAFKDQLFLDLTGRSEASSTLPKDGNTFFYPSASLGWVFTESLNMHNKTLPFGKLRLSYAIVGKDAPVYALKNYYTTGFFADGWTAGIAFPLDGLAGYTADNTLGNPNLKPEKTKAFEIGADLKFLDNRLGLDITYYNNKSEDQILSVPIAGSTGYQYQIKNAGSMENKGIEIMAYITPVKSKNFQWDITLNWSQNKNKVLFLADGINDLFLGGFEGSAIYAVVGQPYGQMYGGRWLRDGSGNIVINEADGLPIQDPTVGVIGDPNPDWTGGITNSFTYKGFSLSALIDIKQGGLIWNGTRGALNNFGMTKETETRGETKVFEGVRGYYDANNNLVITGDANTVPVVLDQSYYQGIGTGFAGPAEQFMEDGSYVKLREVSLSYSINPKLLKKSPFGSIDISLIGRNLWLQTDYSGVDPETSLTGSGNSLGMDYFNMPNTRSYGVSVRVSM
ncbi:MAG: SusC/RagA family TonB-linked outer membrane protein [Bacteroidetes bacterium]|nr:SusC/RagA family TonB-linked outer membrane protein [Bacteroidota bacterium]MBK9542406.1 SusC/RagA family TonB-linked outer membrane protein [Bacteroidota bacterium]MBP6401284.1 SusC/RagA family TonB-linked outer membrane protein [Bacteroidia bacterium]MBP6648196.1 SusC/RagA family TonB-linked outer membrane protein [Bacteroidia bacterium]